MRKLFFLISGVCSLINVKAQLPTTATGNTLVNGTTASNASVASTNSAGFKLSIQGAQINWGTGVNTVTSPTLYLRNTTATTGKIWALNSDNTGLFTISDAVGTTTPLTHTNRFLINATGNMGLGTISNPTTFASLLNLGSTVANSKLAVWDNGTIKTGFGWQAAQLRLHLSATTDKFSFLATEVATTDLMTILGTGNVGIGTTAAPVQKLEVNGTVKSTGLIVTVGAPAAGKFLTSTDASGTATWTATLPVANGGTALTALGTANQQVRVNAAGTALEYFTPAAGGGVSSVFGRSGAVLAAANDYTFAQIGSKPTTLLGYGITDAAASTHTHAIDVLSNVAITTPANGQVLTYNSTSSKWENKTPAAGGASQWTTSGSNISYTTGSVSIGTTTPTALLTLVGPQAATPLFNSTDAVGNICLQVSGLGSITGRNWLIDAANNRTVFGSTSLPLGSAHAFLNNWTNTANVVTIHGTASQSGDYLRILNNTGSVIANVTATGNMGLGVTAPTSRLHLAVTDKIAIGTPDVLNSAGLALTVSDLRFRTSDNYYTGIRSVPGVYDIEAYDFTNNTPANFRSNYMKTNWLYSYSGYTVAKINNGQFQAGNTGNSYNITPLVVLDDAYGPNGTNAFEIKDNAGTATYLAVRNGRLGIGTNNPDANFKLDVQGNGTFNGKLAIGTTDMTKIGTHALAVNGSAIFTKAVVKLNASWPDYVFKPNYQLLPLPELENYLQQHKHLPNIPAAAEVEKNGIDLGNNQTLLLQKVEELTLYMIELNKKVEALVKENAGLKKKTNNPNK